MYFGTILEMILVGNMCNFYILLSLIFNEFLLDVFRNSGRYETYNNSPLISLIFEGCYYWIFNQGLVRQPQVRITNFSALILSLICSQKGHKELEMTYYARLGRPFNIRSYVCMYCQNLNRIKLKNCTEIFKFLLRKFSFFKII